MIRLTYSAGRLDRVSALRDDDAWVTAALTDPTSRAVVLWQDQCLVDADRPVTLPPALWPSREPVLLGRDDDGACWFALDLSDRELTDALALTGATDARNVRRLLHSVRPDEASLLAHARGILFWHRHQQFCGTCGARTRSLAGGHHRGCTGCGKLLFPRIEPAVITLVESPDRDRCLLGRHRGGRSYSTLAGFVEIGESLEDAVRREVLEEVALPVGDVTYQASQAWPFPAGIMLGFRAVAEHEQACPDGDEVLEVRWFTRADVRDLLIVERAAGHQPDSIESFLVDEWLRAGE
ncbi:MAG TPA: NAD(+) diphosphatase [Micromonosporaceae bacterium]|jgi:NAD+ diphosphatase